ncbi:MAG: hypothetical protein PVI49_05915 [Desulfobacterales bacterium]|jgi:hypothetical protein|nr:hypothetical protein [Deltaproteobacteria bacterium]
MKIKSKYIYSFILLVCVHFSPTILSSSPIDPHPTIEIPIFDGGYNVEKFVDASQQTKSIRYSIRTNYPPAEVLEFYDAYFNGRGWQASFEICQRNWVDRGNEKQSTDSIARELFASWAHPEKNLKAVLWLSYEVGNTGSQNEVVVQCQLQPKATK